MSSRVLVVEDDESLRESLSILLDGAGFEVATAGAGPDGLRAFGEDRFDAVVLDLMLPGMDGLDVCRALRRRSPVPIVILSARVETSSLVAGLELGADDYVTKPFEPVELVARLRAAIRRSPDRQTDEVMQVADLEVDLGRYQLRKGGQPVDVSATEFRILAELLSEGGRVLTREQLLKRVWNYDYLGDSRLVDMAVKRLRDKIEDDPSDPQCVVTVRGVGYRAAL